MWKPNIKFASEPLTKGEEVFGIYGNKFFELNNHLGNTMAVISDVRDPNDWNSPLVVQANDYYAYGGQMPGRSYSLNGAKGYRYGFNGKESDSELKGEGNQEDYGSMILG